MDLEGHEKARTPHVFSVDVEEWFHGIPIEARARQDCLSRLEKGLDPLLEMMAARGVLGTFFILGLIAEKRPDIVRRIAKGGHEIACHGWSHQPIYCQTRAEFREETTRARDVLEDLLGSKVPGYRAAYFSITRQTMWALDELVALGFEYDSSIFPVNNWRYGIPDFPARPTRIRTSNGFIDEYPIAVRSIAGRTWPMSGGAYLRLYPFAVTRWNFQHLERTGESAVFYVHPWELDAEHPKIPFRWLPWLTHYYGLGTTRWKIEQLLEAHRFASFAANRRLLGRPVVEIVESNWRA